MQMEIYYGNKKPKRAIGVDFFRGPLADVGDGIDNDRDGEIDEPIDFGVKKNILKCLEKRGVFLKVFPMKTSLDEIKDFKPSCKNYNPNTCTNKHW